MHSVGTSVTIRKLELIREEAAEKVTEEQESGGKKESSGLELAVKLKVSRVFVYVIRWYWNINRPNSSQQSNLIRVKSVGWQKKATEMFRNVVDG